MLSPASARTPYDPRLQLQPQTPHPWPCPASYLFFPPCLPHCLHCRLSLWRGEGADCGRYTKRVIRLFVICLGSLLTVCCGRGCYAFQVVSELHNWGLACKARQPAGTTTTTTTTIKATTRTKSYATLRGRGKPDAERPESKTSSQSCYVILLFFPPFLFLISVGCRSWPSSCPVSGTHTHVIIITIFGFIKWPEEMRSDAASGRSWGKTKGSTKLNNNKSAQDSSHPTRRYFSLKQCDTLL